MFPNLNLFGAAIATAPLVILLGIWFGSSLSEKHATKFKTAPAEIYNLIFLLLLSFVIGGRLSYAAQHPAAFSADPRALISRNFGLFDPFGGTAIALIAALIYGQRKSLKLWPTLDALTPAIAVLMFAIPIANLASGNAFGAPTSLPWAIELWGETRHPVQVYEAIAAAGVLYWLWPSRLPKKGILSGTTFFKFVAASAFSRLIFEGLRGASPINFLGFRTFQLIAWVILAAALTLLYYLYQPTSKPE